MSDELKAGRELDKLIGDMLDIKPVGAWSEYNAENLGNRVRLSNFKSGKLYPSFSTDLNISMRLLNDLRNHGELTIEPYDNNTWRVYDDYSHIYNGVADTLAEAICRAWLAWKQAD